MRGNASKFREAEDVFLRGYGNSIGVEIAAEMLGRSVEGTRARMYHLGINPLAKDPWTPKLEHKALQLSLAYNASQIAKKLKMPYMVVKRKLEDLGVESSHAAYQRKKAEQEKAREDRILYLYNKLEGLYRQRGWGLCA